MGGIAITPAAGLAGRGRPCQCPDMDALLYGGLTLDRAAELRRDPARLAALSDGDSVRILPYWRGRALIDDAQRAIAAAGAAGRALRDAAAEVVFLGIDSAGAWFVADVSALPGDEDVGPDLGLGGRFAPLRGVAAALPAAEAALLGYGRAMLHWHRRHRHCGACGGATTATQGGHVRRCDACGLDHFPRTDPAVIVLVADGDRCLLGRQPHWPPGMYSCLAGFVEPGESLEEATAREVREETGIEIAAPRYRASQPWPFPGSLMVGFDARAVGGALRVDPHELEDARWFTAAEVAAFDGSPHFLPRRDSIARWLVEAWLSDTSG